jgi:peptidylprolyl isomerase
MKLVFGVLALSASSVLAQTAPVAPKTAVHHAATTTSSLTNPPGVPHGAGIPKTLYALKYIDIKVGTGPLAGPQGYYTVNYTGWLTTGKKFDSSYDHKLSDGKPAGPLKIPIGAHPARVIIGWDTGFEGMRVGGKRRLFIPYQLAYREFGNPVIPGKANLIFDVELVGFEPPPPPQAAPKAGEGAGPGGMHPGAPVRPAAPAAPATPAAPAGSAAPATPAAPAAPATPPPAQ